jgi:DNA-binding SARP family transcriptional activator
MGIRDGGAALAVRLLGEFRVDVRGQVVTDAQWTRPQARMLLKLLALEPTHQIHRQRLIEVMWPSIDPAAGAANLHKIIHMARRALEPTLRSGADSRFIITSRQHVQLQAAGGLWIDAEAFELLASRARASGIAAEYEDALTLYRGVLLAEDPYADWCAPKREQLHALRDDLLLGLGRTCSAHGLYPRAIQQFENVLATAPANEDAHRELMRLYALSGRRSDALRQFARCSAAVRAELDADVEDATLQLYRQIVARDIRPLATPSPAHAPTIDAVAVLPFDNETNDPDLEYLSSGIADSVIRNLSQAHGLRVLAYSTVARYRRKSVSPQRIGRDLDVRALVTGRIARAGTEVTIAPELVSTVDGARLWGEQYRLPQHDMLAVQEEISREIAEKLRVRMTVEERRLVVRRYTADPDAYGLYLKGRFHWNKRTADGLTRGIDYFEQAIQRDSAYALAYSGLADCYNLLSLYSVLPPGETMPRAKAAAEKALEIDASLAEAHTSLAYVHVYYDRDWDAAEREFRCALAINPNYATAHHWYHEFLTAMGRFEEQAAEILLAQELDPLSLIISTDVGWGLYYRRSYDDAIEQLRRTLDLDANFAVAHVMLGLAYAQKRMLTDAQSSVQRAIDLSGNSPSTLALAALGYVHAIGDRRAKAWTVVERLTALPRASYAADYCGALVLAGLNDRAAACDLLEKAVAARSDRLIYLNVEPIFDACREDPRFRQLVAAVGLPMPRAT